MGIDKFNGPIIDQDGNDASEGQEKHSGQPKPVPGPWHTGQWYQ